MEPSTSSSPAIQPRRVRAPLAPLAAAMVAGMVAGRWLELTAGAWACLAAAGLVLAAATLRWEHLRRFCTAGLLVAAVGLSAAYLRWSCFTTPADHIVTYAPEGRMLAQVEGRIVSAPQIVSDPPGANVPYRREPRTAFLLDADAIETSAGVAQTQGLVRATVEEPCDHLAAGQRVRLVCWMGRFKPAKNPGEMDAAQWGQLNHTRVWAKVPVAQGVIVLEEVSPGWLSRMAWNVRAAFRQHLESAGEDETDGELVNALILGDRHRGLASLNRAMMRAGVSHYLSISGSHLAIFLGFVYLLCRLAAMAPRRSAIVVLAVLAGYLLLAEPSAPLLRSAIMAAALCVAVILERPYSSVNALAAAMIVLLAIDPLALFTAGFQLSFGIVLGLLVMTGPLRRWMFGRSLRRRGLMVFRTGHWRLRWLERKAADWAMTAVAMSLAAWVVSLPLVAYHFHMVNLYAAPLSLLLTLPVAAVLVPGYLSMALLWPMPNLSWRLGEVSAAAADALTRMVGWAQHLPALSIDIRPVGVAWTVACYAAIGALLLRKRWDLMCLPKPAGPMSRDGNGAGGASHGGTPNLPVNPPPPSRSGLAGLAALILTTRSQGLHEKPAPHVRWGTACCAALLIVVAGLTVWTQWPARPPQNARLHVLAVGAGQCVVLQTAAGKTYLLDAGSRSLFDCWEQTLRPFLRQMRLPTPDACFVSHANSDHYNALPPLIATCPPARTYLGEYFAPGATAAPMEKGAQRLLDELKAAGVSVVRLRAGDEVALDDRTKVRVLWPPARRSADDFKDVNDTSLVLRVECGGFSALLPGDAAKEAQLALVRQELPRCDVMILPHHGGWQETLPELVRKVDPKTVIVSNSFDPGERLSAREFYRQMRKSRRVLQTWRDGCLVVELGPEKVSVSPER